jgi:hypothetical protein
VTDHLVHRVVAADVLVEHGQAAAPMAVKEED